MHLFGLQNNAQKTVEIWRKSIHFNKCNFLCEF